MRYGVVTLIIAFLAIIGTVVFVSLNSGPAATSSARVTRLADYDGKDSANISWTMQGRLVGEDQRRAIRVIVSRETRSIEILAGYAERVERSAQYTNSPESFAAFTRALDVANFGRERNVSQPDERGICPLGNRFIYRLTDYSNEIMRTWSDSCQVANGPFGGDKSARLIQQIFKDQIPDYIKFTNGVKL